METTINKSNFYGECPILSNKHSSKKLSVLDLLFLPLLHPIVFARKIENKFWNSIKDQITNDHIYAYLVYYHNMHKWLHLHSPRTFNEKLQWLMLYNRDPRYSALVDKFEVKDYIKGLIGEEHIIPTLGVWDKFDDINFDELPSQFVLKATNDSGGVYICKDKSKLDRIKAREIIENSRLRDYYKISREWPYKNVSHKVIAEQYMEDESGYELKDYKFFCFDGEPKMLFIATDRPHDTRFDFFDTEFNHLPFAQGHPWARKKLSKPEKFEEMIDISRKLSQGFPHVRVDLYNINGTIYFGELTFYHFGGSTPIIPLEWDYKIGEWLRLPGHKLQ